LIPWRPWFFKGLDWMPEFFVGTFNYNQATFLFDARSFVERRRYWQLIAARANGKRYGDSDGKTGSRKWETRLDCHQEEVARTECTISLSFMGIKKYICWWEDHYYCSAPSYSTKVATTQVYFVVVL
jgi:hypothetical protein